MCNSDRPKSTVQARGRRSAQPGIAPLLEHAQQIRRDALGHVQPGQPAPAHEQGRGVQIEHVVALGVLVPFDVDAAVGQLEQAHGPPERGGPPPAPFDVKLQGKTVAKQLGLAGASGGKNRPVIREFKNVAVALDLKIDLIAPPKTPPARLPILSAVEVVRTKVVPGMTKPPKPTTNPAPKKTGSRKPGKKPPSKKGGGKGR